MTPTELKAAQAAQIAQLEAAGANAVVALEKIAMTVARAVRADAARSGQHIGIRVVRRASGVRLTITGPGANRYRGAVEKAMKDKAPAAAVEIRTMLTKRPR